MAQDKNKPVHEIRLGRIKATIWHNETESGSSRHNVQMRRLYRDDKSSDWKTSDSFGRDDLMLVAEVARQAAVWIHQRAQDEV
jgi:hypothetical protein